MTVCASDPRPPDMRLALTALGKKLDRLYDRWERGLGGYLLRRSCERLRQPARFWIHRAADRLEFAFDDAFGTGPRSAPDPDPRWRAFYDSWTMQELALAVNAFVSLPDDEITAMRPRRGFTPQQVRMLILDQFAQIMFACADRRREGVRSRACDLQIMLDPAPTSEGHAAR
jgi:hypothetical protein